MSENYYSSSSVSVNLIFESESALTMVLQCFFESLWEAGNSGVKCNGEEWSAAFVFISRYFFDGIFLAFSMAASTR